MRLKGGYEVEFGRRTNLNLDGRDPSQEILKRRRNTALFKNRDKREKRYVCMLMHGNSCMYACVYVSEKDAKSSFSIMDRHAREEVCMYAHAWEQLYVCMRVCI